MYSTPLCDSLTFESKVKNIHQQLLASNSGYDFHYLVFHVSPHSAFSTFSLPNAVGILCLIRKSKSITCWFDPLPTRLVKACLPSLSPLITQIIHSSCLNYYLT